MTKLSETLACVKELLKRVISHTTSNVIQDDAETLLSDLEGTICQKCRGEGGKQTDSLEDVGCGMETVFDFSICDECDGSGLVREA